MNMKKLQKACLLSALFGSALGVSLQSYANDTVTFYVGVVDSTRADTKFSLSPNDEELVPSDTRLKFTHTNIYKEGEMIAYSDRQQQSGSLSVMQQEQGASYPSVRCIAKWEHDFWIDKQGKHDRFYVVISNSAGYCEADNIITKFSGVHKSDHTSWIRTAPVSAAGL